VTTDAQAEIKKLKRENAELRRANEILKAASVESTRQRNILTQPRVFCLQLLDLGMVEGGHPVAGAVVDIGLQHPPPHGFVADTDLAGYSR